MGKPINCLLELQKKIFERTSQGDFEIKVSCPDCGGHRKVVKSEWVCTECGLRKHIISQE
jgi:rubredoxin